MLQRSSWMEENFFIFAPQVFLIQKDFVGKNTIKYLYKCFTLTVKIVKVAFTHQNSATRQRMPERGTYTEVFIFLCSKKIGSKYLIILVGMFCCPVSLFFFYLAILMSCGLFIYFCLEKFSQTRGLYSMKLQIVRESLHSRWLPQPSHLSQHKTQEILQKLS